MLRVIRARGSASLLIALALSACATATVERPRESAVTRTTAAVVEKVVDGDTAWLKLDGGTREKVRFIGVDTPESTTQQERFGKEAAAFTASMLTVGLRVSLELDVDERDWYGRLLAYVWLRPPATGGDAEARERMLNAMLVEKGFATVLTVPPNVQYVDLFVALQLEARIAGRGVWA
jgi:micrococcal nuclease